MIISSFGAIMRVRLLLINARFKLQSLRVLLVAAPDYHVAATGSLLGVAIKRDKFSFPVGKVKSMNLYPMDFEEFLWASGEERLTDTS